MTNEPEKPEDSSPKILGPQTRRDFLQTTGGALASSGLNPLSATAKAAVIATQAAAANPVIPLLEAAATQFFKTSARSRGRFQENHHLPELHTFSDPEAFLKALGDYANIICENTKQLADAIGKLSGGRSFIHTLKDAIHKHLKNEVNPLQNKTICQDLQEIANEIDNTEELRTLQSALSHAYNPMQLSSFRTPTNAYETSAEIAKYFQNLGQKINSPDSDPLTKEDIRMLDALRNGALDLFADSESQALQRLSKLGLKLNAIYAEKIAPISEQYGVSRDVIDFCQPEGLILPHLHIYSGKYSLPMDNVTPEQIIDHTISHLRDITSSFKLESRFSKAARMPDLVTPQTQAAVERFEQTVFQRMPELMEKAIAQYFPGHEHMPKQEGESKEPQEPAGKHTQAEIDRKIERNWPGYNGNPGNDIY